MTLAEVELLRVRMPLRRPFTTSFGTSTHKECLLIRAAGDDGTEGWGECTTMERPAYSSEYVDGAWGVLRDHLVPAALEDRDARVRGHHMARAGLEVSVVDMDLRRRGLSLARLLGGERDRVPCGVSIGIEHDIEDLLTAVRSFVDQGYRRIKLKIEPGRDVDVVRAVREAFPDTALSVDANAAYDENSGGSLVALDDFDLQYIEQPFPEDDLLGHIALQRRIRTPICLDETVTSAAVARAAIELGACRVINVKLGRVGGLAEARKIHDLSVAAGVPLWVGGMLETGVGRAANVALASMPGFTLPGDTSGSDRYFERDLTEPFVVEPDGTMSVPEGPGLGVTPIPEVLDEVVVDRLSLTV